jgi:hypothetical protein
MKSRFWTLIALALGAALSVPVQAETGNTTLRGVISDSMCKGDHASMIKMGGYGTNAASCAEKCLKEGNSIVFVDNKTKAVYTLQNGDAAKKFAGKNVVINGHVDADAKVIHVQSVKRG